MRTASLLLVVLLSGVALASPVSDRQAIAVVDATLSTAVLLGCQCPDQPTARYDRRGGETIEARIARLETALRLAKAEAMVNRKRKP